MRTCKGVGHKKLKEIAGNLWPEFLKKEFVYFIIFRYERCAKCCRMDKESVCRAHGTGYESAIAQIELALTHQLFCVDIRCNELL